MKLAFGRVPEEFKNDGGYYQGVNAEGEIEEFYFFLKVNEEGDSVTIRDTCNRYMPMDMDSLDELTDILLEIREYRNDRHAFIKYWQDRFGLPQG